MTRRVRPYACWLVVSSAQTLLAYNHVGTTAGDYNIRVGIHVQGVVQGVPRRFTQWDLSLYGASILMNE